MKKKINKKIIIFTDLDGSLLDRETFRFDSIKNYILKLLKKEIFIVPNSSKTKKEILLFNNELKKNLPIICENGSAIYGLNNLNKNLPDNIILSRDKDEIYKVFKKNIPKKLQLKCKFIHNMSEKKQFDIMGLKGKALNLSLTREYSIPFIFNDNKIQKKKFIKLVSLLGLSIHEGGRVLNLCDKVSKALAMKKLVKIYKKIDSKKLITIGVGDNYNDLDMLKFSNFPCLVFNDKFKKDKINIKGCLVSTKSSPEGWEEIVKLALDKANIKV